MNITILTVDTDYTRTLLNSKLEEQNHTVVAESNNYEEALNLYNTYLPDIIILDIDLGDTNKGLSFLSDLLKIDPSAKIIALSSFFQDSTKARLFKLGIDRLVMKPYQPAHIWQQIDEISETNNLLKLRKEREKLVHKNSLSNDTYNKSNQLNKQILSLRDQISKSRNVCKTDEEEIISDSSNENYVDTYQKSNLNSYNDISLDDFSLDLSYIEENDKQYDYYSTEIHLDNHKTNKSDNFADINISLYDIQKEQITHNIDEYNLNREDSKIENEVERYNSYLGLPVFIDRNNNFKQDDTFIEEHRIAQESPTETSQNKLFQKLLKKKGGK